MLRFVTQRGIVLPTQLLVRRQMPPDSMMDFQNIFHEVDREIYCIFSSVTEKTRAKYTRKQSRQAFSTLAGVAGAALVLASIIFQFHNCKIRMTMILKAKTSNP